MLKEAGQANSVVCQMRLFANYYNVVLARSGIEFEEFLSVGRLEISAFQGLELTHCSHEADAHHPQTNNNNLLAPDCHCGQAVRRIVQNGGYRKRNKPVEQ